MTDLQAYAGFVPDVGGVSPAPADVRETETTSRPAAAAPAPRSAAADFYVTPAGVHRLDLILALSRGFLDVKES